MRVLWFTNTSSCYSNGTANCYNGGGWISSLEREMWKRPDVDMAVCFYFSGIDRPKKEVQDKTTYYLLPRPKKSWKYAVKTIFEAPERSTWEHEKLAIPALVDVVNDFRPDVIQVFGSENIYGLVAKHVSVPVVLHIQGILTTCLNAFLPPFMSWRMFLWQDVSVRRLLHRFSDRIAWRRNSVTERRMIRSVQHYMGHSVWDRRVTHLLNPQARYYSCGEILRECFYDPACERRLPVRPVFVTTISSQHYKGLDLVLKTAQALHNVREDFEWLVFGDVNPKLTERVFHVKHSDVNVRLMGVATAEQIKAALLSATAYVHPSYIDNASNSLCEAQLLGVTSVATYVGGIPSVVEDGVTGFLVPANDPFQMACLMNFLSEHAERNVAMGKAARGVAMRRHDKSAIVERVMEIYAEMLSKPEK